MLKAILLNITIVFGGQYWRLLTPGEYQVTAVKSGYEPQTQKVVVKNPAQEEALRLDFKLKPVQVLDPQLMSSDDYYGYKPLPDHVNLNNPEVLRLIHFLQRAGAQNNDAPQ